ncbi:MAG TPA: helix-turn-helix transcriptional regulator [Polyangiaceae bacterium]
MAQPTALFQEHYLLPSTVHGAIWPLSRDYPKPRHFHAQLELLVLVRGRAQVRIGRTLHTAHAGQLVWHLPGVEHVLHEASADCDLRVLHIEPDLCAAVVREVAPLAPAASHPVTRTASLFDWTRPLGELASGRPVVELKQRDRDLLLDQCDATCVDPALSASEVSARLRAALSTALRATLSDHDDQRALSLVELASCLLLENPGLERAQVCRALDVSEGYLSRRFQLELGISFSEQRARSRICRFVSQVARNGTSYLEAALESGFGSYSQLHRSFTQIVCTSPRAYFSPTLRNLRANRLTYQ